MTTVYTRHPHLRKPVNGKPRCVHSGSTREHTSWAVPPAHVRRTIIRAHHYTRRKLGPHVGTRIAVVDLIPVSHAHVTHKPLIRIGLTPTKSPPKRLIRASQVGVYNSISQNAPSFLRVFSYTQVK